MQRFIPTLILGLAITLVAEASESQDTTSSSPTQDMVGAKGRDFTVACYYFPNYHPNEARNERLRSIGKSLSFAVTHIDSVKNTEKYHHLDLCVTEGVRDFKRSVTAMQAFDTIDLKRTVTDC